MDEWWKEVDTIERKIKIEWRRIEINKREIEELKKRKKEAGAVKQIMCSVLLFSDLVCRELLFGH